MESRIEKLNRMQEESAEALFKQQWATVELCTGFGKTFTAFKAAYKVKALAESTYDKKFKPTVLILAETTVREKTFRDEAKKFKEIFGKDFYKDFKVTFACYQARIKRRKFHVLIADEIHDSITPAYSKVFKENGNHFMYVFGLSATIPDDPMDHEDETSMTKRAYIMKHIPIVYTYALDEAINDGILSPFETTVIRIPLDDVVPMKKIGNKKLKVRMTEERYYHQRQAKINKIRDKKLMATDGERNYSKMLALENCRLLWGLQSKKKYVDEVVSDIEGKSIIFGTDLNLLKSVCKHTVSSKNSDVVNKSYINKFNNSKIDTIGSFKILKQGITLAEVQNCILASYFSKSKDLIQQLGRTIRFVEGKTARLIIIVTEGTMEEKWFNTLSSEINLNVVDTINYCHEDTDDIP